MSWAISVLILWVIFMLIFLRTKRIEKKYDKIMEARLNENIQDY